MTYSEALKVVELGAAGQLEDGRRQVVEVAGLVDVRVALAEAVHNDTWVRCLDADGRVEAILVVDRDVEVLLLLLCRRGRALAVLELVVQVDSVGAHATEESTVSLCDAE